MQFGKWSFKSQGLFHGEKRYFWCMVKSLETSGQDNDNNNAPWSALHLCWVLCTQHPRCCGLCCTVGTWVAGSLGTKCKVGSGPRSYGPQNLKIFFPPHLPISSSLWVWVIWPKWVLVCTSVGVIMLCSGQPPALGAGNAWKAMGLQNHSLFLPKDSFQARRKFCVRPFTSRKAGVRDLMLFLCIGSFREKKVLLAPKAHLDYLESQ